MFKETDTILRYYEKSIIEANKDKLFHNIVFKDGTQYRVVHKASLKDKEIVINHLEELIQNYALVRKLKYRRGRYREYKEKITVLREKLRKLFENKRFVEFTS